MFYVEISKHYAVIIILINLEEETRSAYTASQVQEKTLEDLKCGVCGGVEGHGAFKGGADVRVSIAPGLSVAGRVW